MDGTLSRLAVVITAKTDQFSKGIDGVSNKVDKFGKQMKIAAAAITAMGVAGLKLVADARKMNAELGVTALNLGITTKEMRDLALSTTNVTFPLAEVTKTFDLLARAGVKDQEVLKAVATSFDTLGDAIGVPASQVTAQLIPAMKTFNISAEEMAAKTDSLTWLFRNTTVNLEDFNRMVGYTTPELVAMGLTTEDMIGILAELEEQGYSGEVMTREFRKAVTLATKEQIPLNEALGISTEKIEEYKVEMESATGITQEYADVANEQYGIMDKLKQKFSELTLVAGSFLTPLEPILAAMTALGPMMFFLSTGMGVAAIKTVAHTIAMVAHKVALLALAIATKVAAAAQWLLNVAMSANPIGLIILAIGGLVAAIIWMVKNWDVVVEHLTKIWEWMKMAFQAVVNFFKNALGAIANFFTNIFEGIANFLKGIWDRITGVFSTAWDGLVNIAKTAVNFILGIINSMIAGFEGAINFIIRGINAFIGLMNKPIELLNKIPGVNLPLIPKLGKITLPRIPLLDVGGIIEGPGLFAVGHGVKEIVREPGAGGNVINNFEGPWFIREEADINKIARELYRLQQQKQALMGIQCRQ